MKDFRKITPARRGTVATVNSYTKYKPLLREDFNERCGYCGDHDFFRDTFYEVDHFVPKTQLKSISITEYSNLVYSCRACNNFKRSKWPTQNEHIHNDGKQGFIDPCNPKYAEQFERMQDGSIAPKTVLGTWMWSALNMGNPVHRLKWKLEELRIILEELNKIASDDSIEELRMIKRISEKYLQLEEDLRGNPNFN